MAYIPDNPFSGLPRERRDVWETIPGVEYIPEKDLGYAQSLYAVGFGYKAPEYDRMGITPDAVHKAREDYFDYMGLEWENFPWDDWREAMGYDEQ